MVYRKIKKNKNKIDYVQIAQHIHWPGWRISNFFWSNPLLLHTWSRTSWTVHLGLARITYSWFLGRRIWNKTEGQESRGPFLTSSLGANFDPRGEFVPQGRICPPGVTFVPWGWSCPLGVKFSVSSSILLNSRECSPRGERRGEHFP
jgi:hypothetical protein